MSFFPNSSFAAGLAPWRPFNFAQNVATAIGTDGTAFTGNSFMRFQVSRQSASVAVDFNPVLFLVASDSNGGPVGGNVFPGSIAAQAFVRSKPGLGNVSGTLAFWQLGLPNNQINNPLTRFSVGNAWTPLHLFMDLVPVGLHLPSVRLEIYLDTLNTALDVGAIWVS